MNKIIPFLIVGILVFSGVGMAGLTTNNSQDIRQSSFSMPSIQNVISVVPATTTAIIEKSSIQADIVDCSEKLSRGHIAYAYIAYSSEYTNGPCYFDVENPGAITKLSNEQVTNFLFGGTYTSDERWLCCQYGTGILYKVTIDTGHITEIGGGGVNLNDLAYDPVTKKLYGLSYDSFYEIDIKDGTQQFIGGSGFDSMDCIAFDEEGTCYGIGSNSTANNLYTIDFSTGEATFVRPLINYTGAFNAEFDIDNDILYLIGFTTGYMTGLYTCDTETGECHLVGQFEGETYLAALAIPYNWSGPTADFTWTPNLPNPGETILFNASASYDPEGYIKLYEWDWDNDGVFDENHTSPTSTHSWPDEGSYPVTLKVTDNTSLIGMETKKVRVGNQPPNPPIITGPTHGKVGVEYEYNFSLSDPDDDSMYLRVDWGNGTPSPWHGPYDSDTTVKLNHIWSKEGTYTIRAQAKDIYDGEGDWATLKVSMPVYQQNNQNNQQSYPSQNPNQQNSQTSGRRSHSLLLYKILDSVECYGVVLNTEYSTLFY